MSQRSASLSRSASRLPRSTALVKAESKVSAISVIWGASIAKGPRQEREGWRGRLGVRTPAHPGCAPGASAFGHVHGVGSLQLDTFQHAPVAERYAGAPLPELAR